MGSPPHPVLRIDLSRKGRGDIRTAPFSVSLRLDRRVYSRGRLSQHAWTRHSKGRTSVSNSTCEWALRSSRREAEQGNRLPLSPCGRGRGPRAQARGRVRGRQHWCSISDDAVGDRPTPSPGAHAPTSPARGEVTLGLPPSPYPSGLTGGSTLRTAHRSMRGHGTARAGPPVKPEGCGSKIGPTRRVPCRRLSR